MINFKNYERVTKKDWKTGYEIGKCVQDGSAGECPVYNNGFKYIKRLAELEDMIEQSKLVEKIEPKTAKERVEIELAELLERKEKLFKFVGTSKYATLSIKSKKLLFKQYSIMLDYIDILQERLKIWEE